MNPDSSQPGQVGQPNLPPVAAIPGPGQQPVQAGTPSTAPSMPPASPTPDQLASWATAEAKKIAQTYHPDPYMQSQAFGQLKARYLQDTYHLKVDTAGQ